MLPDEIKKKKLQWSVKLPDEIGMIIEKLSLSDEIGIILEVISDCLMREEHFKKSLSYCLSKKVCCIVW